MYFLRSNNSWGPASLQSVLQTVRCWELQVKSTFDFSCLIYNKPYLPKNI